MRYADHVDLDGDSRAIDGPTVTAFAQEIRNLVRIVITDKVTH